MRHCLRRKVAADVYADQFNQQPVSKSQHSATADQSIVAVRDSSVNNRLFPLRLIVIQCKLVFPWPFSVMAPRNASRQPSVVAESSGRSPNKSPPLSESGDLSRRCTADSRSSDVFSDVCYVSVLMNCVVLQVN